MKIAFLSPSHQPGGAERSLVDLIHSLRLQDPSLEMWLVCAAEGAVAGMAREAGARIRVVPMPPMLAGAGDSSLRFEHGWLERARVTGSAAAAMPAALWWAAGLTRALRELAPDIVHSNDNKSHAVSAWLPLKGARVVWHVRDFLGRRGLISRALRPSARRVAGAIAISEAVAEDVRRLLGRTPVRVVHNAVDTECFSPGEAEPEWLDGQAGLGAAPPGTVRIGLVAAFARWKGHLLFLQAAAGMLSRRPHAAVRFYIVGGPIYATAGSQHQEADLRREAARRGLDGRLGFTGFQSDVARVYRTLDIVVHASTDPEPFGRTIVEAMGCGRAVVASREGGAAELFTDGEDALGFRPGDAGGLSEAMARLSEDPDLRARLGRRARHTAETRFSRRRLGPEVLDAYRSFIASGRGS